MTADDLAHFLANGGAYELAREGAAEFYAETRRIEEERAELARRKREPGKPAAR